MSKRRVTVEHRTLKENGVLTDSAGNDFRVYKDEIIEIVDGEVYYLMPSRGKTPAMKVLTNMRVDWTKENTDE